MRGFQKVLLVIGCLIALAWGVATAFLFWKVVFSGCLTAGSETWPDCAAVRRAAVLISLGLGILSLPVALILVLAGIVRPKPDRP